MGCSSARSGHLIDGVPPQPSRRFLPPRRLVRSIRRCRRCRHPGSIRSRIHRHHGPIGLFLTRIVSPRTYTTTTPQRRRGSKSTRAIPHVRRRLQKIQRKFVRRRRRSLPRQHHHRRTSDLGVGCDRYWPPRAHTHAPHPGPLFPATTAIVHSPHMLLPPLLLLLEQSPSREKVHSNGDQPRSSDRRTHADPYNGARAELRMV